MSENISYNFTELEDGSLPSQFGYATRYMEGIISGMLGESDPSLYYEIQNGRALFNYTEEIIGSRTFQRGLFSSPGHFSGSNASMRISFDNPLLHFNRNVDIFAFQIALGFRGENKLENWIGGLIEAYWTPLGWNPKWKLSLVKVENAIISYEESKTEGTNFVDINELTFSIDGNSVYTGFNGRDYIEKEIDFEGEGSICLMCRITTTLFDINTSYGILRKFSAESLQDSIPGPMKEHITQFIEPEVYEAHFVFVPLPELARLRYIKQLGPNIWEFTQDVTVNGNRDIPGFSANKGAIMVDHRNLLPEYPLHICKFKYNY